MFQWMSKKLNQKRKGFTLIELVVVVAILGILAAIAIPRFTGVREDANAKAVLANLRVLESAAGTYAAQENVQMTAVDSGTEAVKTSLTALVGTWPDQQPTGVTYTVVDGQARAVVAATVAFPTITPATEGYYIISDLD